jgi:hypothetical protein
MLPEISAMRIRPAVSALAVLCLLASAAHGSTDLYVSVDGRDANPGSREKPFATLGHARDAIRQIGVKSGPVTVHVRGGTYYLPETLVFTAADSGTKDAPVTYAAEPGEEVVLSGGSRLELRWEPYKDGIFKAATPPGLTMDQLFVAGKRQPMARYPNFDAKQPIYNGYAADAFSPERAAHWADPAGG